MQERHVTETAADAMVIATAEVTVADEGATAAKRSKKLLQTQWMKTRLQIQWTKMWM